MRNLFVAAGLAAAGLLYSGGAQAGSFTLSFIGEITACDGDCAYTAVGKRVSGEFTLNETPGQDFTSLYMIGAYVGTWTEFANSRWSAEIEADSSHAALEAHQDNTAFGIADLFPAGGPTPLSVIPTASFLVGDDGYLSVDLQLSVNHLLSLANFPAFGSGSADPSRDCRGIYCGQLYVSAAGSYYTFAISSFTTAVTPIPAALPLFITAIAGLGAFAWRRRSA